jgi:hypothetical protein
MEMLSLKNKMRSMPGFSIVVFAVTYSGEFLQSANFGLSYYILAN